ncbi:hypothetical protein GCM10007382_20620 [Salinibacterium xinjiangense]|nr:hypothetical protein GCM10007382_20620 [Salinibacterium xinjiangense]
MLCKSRIIRWESQYIIPDPGVVDCVDDDSANGRGSHPDRCYGSVWRLPGRIAVAGGVSFPEEEAVPVVLEAEAAIAGTFFRDHAVGCETERVGQHSQYLNRGCEVVDSIHYRARGIYDPDRVGKNRDPGDRWGWGWGRTGRLDEGSRNGRRGRRWRCARATDHRQCQRDEKDKMATSDSHSRITGADGIQIP